MEKKLKPLQIKKISEKKVLTANTGGAYRDCYYDNYGQVCRWCGWLFMDVCGRWEPV